MPGLLVNRGIREFVVVLASIVDFATNVIGLGVMAHTAESSARSSRANEGVVLETNQAVGNTQASISRDGVNGANKTNIFSCLLVQNNFEFPDISSVTPINVDNLSVQLCGHKVEYVLTGFRVGFRLGFHPESMKLKSAKANCPSSLKHLSVIDNYLAKEVSSGRMFGPTATPPANNLQINRFGVIPKRDGGWRLILDLSFLFGHGVNGV